MHSIRVLIVDDFTEWRHFVRMAIREIAYPQNIREACDGEEAIEKARDWKPGLALLDIGLPKINGIEAARQIRKLCPECKVIFFTENRSSDVRDECFSAGASAYIVKSSGANDLVLAINAEIIIAELYESVLKFAEGSRQQDDLTAVLIKRSPDEL